MSYPSLGIPLVTVSNNPVVLGALLFILDVGWASAFIFSTIFVTALHRMSYWGVPAPLDGAVFGLGNAVLDGRGSTDA